MQDVSDLTGQGNYGGTPRVEADEIHLQGSAKPSAPYPVDAGLFKVKLMTGPRDEEKGYKVEALPKPGGDAPAHLDVVFLKIRRVMRQYRKGLKPLITSEHNNKFEKVILFNADGGPRVGTSDELRAAYQGLRVQQIVYVFVPSLGRVCKLIVKGMGLMGDKDGGILGFYDYLQDASKRGFKVHKTLTRLKACPREDYFAMGFEKGEDLTEERQAKIDAMVVDLHGRLTALDAHYASKIAKMAGTDVDAPAPAELPTIEIEGETAAVADDEDYPDEEAKPDDIPFN